MAMADEKWGESPCAFVLLKEKSDVSGQDIIDFCRLKMAKFKVPKKIIFTQLPKTSTGKIQKNILRTMTDQQ